MPAPGLSGGETYTDVFIGRTTRNSQTGVEEQTLRRRQLLQCVQYTLLCPLLRAEVWK
jgi:hypothetical protein